VTERDDAQAPDETLATTDEHDEFEPVVEPGNASDEAVASLEELVRYLVTHLVDEPDSVEIDLERRGGAVHVQLHMPEEELGKVIGRGGRIAKAIRTVLLIAGSRHNVRVTLDIES
jgi:uncharacterized protein